VGSEMCIRDRDSKSSDDTATIARQYGAKIISTNELRSGARNIGADAASGQFLLFADSDMQLNYDVVSNCVRMARSNMCDALIIPERRQGEGFWAKCRAFERTMYVGDPLIESARFVRSTIFSEVGGFDGSMEAGEDWDFQSKLDNKGCRVGKVSAWIIHNEGRLGLERIVRKRFQYGKSILRYIRKNPRRAAVQYSPIRLNYVRNRRLLTSEPLLSSGFFFMKFVEYLTTLLSIPLTRTGLAETARRMDSRTIVAVGHVDATGPVQALEDFFSETSADFTLIGHPFYAKKGLPSFFKSYKDGRLSRMRSARSFNGPELFQFLKHFITTVAFVLNSKKRVDLFVGIDGLNAVAGLALMRLGFAKTVIFYTIDLVPHRFANPLLNRIYRMIDEFAVTHSNHVWNLSSTTQELRSQWGYPEGKVAPQRIVPVGVDLQRIKRAPREEVDPRSLVYLGSLRPGQGLDLILNTFPKLASEFPRIRLTIIGDGPLKTVVTRWIDECGYANQIRMLGFVSDRRIVEEVVSRCGVGLALYEPETSFAGHTEPSKPKTYMACGLPVVITRVPSIAQDIEKAKAGIVINYDGDQFISAIRKLITDDQFADTCRKNAVDFVSNYAWERIYCEALTECGLIWATKRVTRPM